MKKIICFLWIISLTKETHSVEFNVIGNLAQENEFGCNTQVILQCIVNPKTDPVFWQVGKPVTETSDLAAECSGFVCTNYSSLYGFSYNENTGESNMTIDVTLAEDGNQYRCDDRSTSKVLEAVVQVPPVKENTHISSITVAQTSTITVSTGCVTNRTAQRIAFKWLIIHENGCVEDYLEATSPSSSDDLPCQINSDCISIGSAVLSNYFTITEDENAPKAYFQVQVLLDGNFLFSVNTTSTFQLKSLISTSSPSTQNSWNITISTVNNTTTSASLQTTVSDGCTNSSDCCDCDIEELFIVIAVAWASDITLAFVGSCILKYSLRKTDLCEGIFKLATLPSIFQLGVVLLYKGKKKWELELAFLLISFVLDAAFIGIDRYYVCLCENACEIELLDHLWASLIYLLVSAVLSVSKYIILEKCCGSDSTVSNSNSDLNQTEVQDNHGPLGTRPLPRISSVSSRLGNEREQEHSLKHAQLMKRSPLPPISSKEHGKTVERHNL